MHNVLYTYAVLSILYNILKNIYIRNNSIPITKAVYPARFNNQHVSYHVCLSKAKEITLGINHRLKDIRLYLLYRYSWRRRGSVALMNNNKPIRTNNIYCTGGWFFFFFILFLLYNFKLTPDDNFTIISIAAYTYIYNISILMNNDYYI